MSDDSSMDLSVDMRQSRTESFRPEFTSELGEHAYDLPNGSTEDGDDEFFS